MSIQSLSGYCLARSALYISPVDSLSTSTEPNSRLAPIFSAILNLPGIFRFPLAKLIANRRTPIAKKIYEELGGSSPILKLTIEQSEKLEKKLNEKQFEK
mgnify:CR=1 FL=1